MSDLQRELAWDRIKLRLLGLLDEAQQIGAIDDATREIAAAKIERRPEDCLRGVLAMMGAEMSEVSP